MIDQQLNIPTVGGVRVPNEPLPFLMSLRGRFLVWFFILSIFPFAVVGVLSYSYSVKTIREQAVNKLVAVRELKRHQVEDFFEKEMHDIATFAETPSTIRAMKEYALAFTELGQDKAREFYLGHSILADANDGSSYSAMHSQHHPFLAKYASSHQYYDLFLVEPKDGVIVYSVMKEDDYGTSLLAGAYANTNIAKAYNKAKELPNTGEVAIVDFEQYEPSSGRPASFIASPIFSNNSLIGVLIFQTPIDRLNAIMTERAGMQKTGETYLVGPDMLMRSQSRFFEETTVLAKKVDTLGVSEAFAGRPASMVITDYRGVSVLSAFSRISIQDLNWAILAEIDEEEAFEPVAVLLLGLVGGSILAVVVLISGIVWVSNCLTKPVIELAYVASEIAEGNFKGELRITRYDEIGVLARAFDDMRKKLHISVRNLELEVIERTLAEANLRRMTETLSETMIELEQQNQELVRFKNRLEQKTLELTHSNKELDDFAYIASHDLKEPLRGMQHYATFIIEDYGEKLEKGCVEQLETIIRLSKRLELFIENLLQYSRLGRVNLAFTKTDLNKVLDDVIDSLRSNLDRGEFEVRVPQSLATVSCDSIRIAEVFRNLITNAMKYNDKPHKWIEVGQEVRRGNEGCSDITVFYVRDNGIGIRKKHLESVFKIFKRLHGRDKFGGGSGAGLTIVKKIIDRHNGRIWVESTFGEGSTFYFTLTDEVVI